MSRVEKLIHDKLGREDVEKLANGYRWTFSRGTTELTIEPVTALPVDEFQLCSIVTIKSHFTNEMPNFQPQHIARLNRRALFGNFLVESGSLGLKLTFPIYDREPAYDFVAWVLLEAFRAQLAFGVGTVQAEISDELLRASRAGLEYPRKWTQPPDPADFEAAAERFRQNGFVTTADAGGLFLEVAFAPGPASRMIEPSAETALLHVTTDVAHPLAGVGYLSAPLRCRSILLPRKWPVGVSTSMSGSTNSRTSFLVSVPGVCGV